MDVLAPRQRLLRQLADAELSLLECGLEEKDLDGVRGNLAHVRARVLGNGKPYELVEVPGKPRVCLCLPRYGWVEAEMMKAAFVTASDDKIMMGVSGISSSLLAFAFNHGWCDCWNQNRFDYFCMLHSDIVPHGPWVDVLIEELERGKYTVMHAVSPIKDGRAITSTALGDRDDIWANVRRIALRELQDKFETFGLRELVDGLEWQEGKKERDWALLPNTGCMLVKWGPWAEDFPGFNIMDKIVKLPERDVNGRAILKPKVVSEDWNFGFWCADQGHPVGGTMKIKIDHYGHACYQNHTKWGGAVRDELFFGCK